MNDAVKQDKLVFLYDLLAKSSLCNVVQGLV